MGRPRIVDENVTEANLVRLTLCPRCERLRRKERERKRRQRDAVRDPKDDDLSQGQTRVSRVTSP